MAPESHPIKLLERIRNCRCYWQLNYFELLRLYLTCTHTPLDSAPSKPLRPLVQLIIYIRRRPNRDYTKRLIELDIEVLRLRRTLRHSRPSTL